MAATPEGKVKARVNKIIARYKNVYKFMPVPAGYGPSSLDYILCVAGRFVAIETKAPSKRPTPRQEFVIKQIMDAGGIVFVIDGEPTHYEQLEKFLEHATRPPEREA